MGHAENGLCRIVCGVDLKPGGDDSIRETQLLAERLQLREMHFVHVIRAPHAVHSARRIARLADEMGPAAWQLDRRVSAVLAERDPTEQEVIFHTRVGPIAAAIHQVAIDVDADLLLVGATQRSLPSRMLHRSMTRRLMRIAHVPVVVAHPKDYQGLRRSEAPAPPRPGHNWGNEGMTTYTRINYDRGQRDSHIAGML